MKMIVYIIVFFYLMLSLSIDGKCQAMRPKRGKPITIYPVKIDANGKEIINFNSPYILDNSWWFEKTSNIISTTNPNGQTREYVKIFIPLAVSQQGVLRTNPHHGFDAVPVLESKHTGYQYFVLEQDIKDVSNFDDRIGRSRVTPGVVSVPYKYRFMAEDSSLYNSAFNLQGGVNIQLFQNRRIAGEHLSLLLGGGLNIGEKIQQTTDGTSLNTMAHLSFAGGLVYFLENGFQFGFIGGYDLIGERLNPKSSRNNSPWLSIGFGYNFYIPNKNQGN